MYWLLIFEEYFLVTFKSPISNPSFPFTSLGKYPLYKFLFFLFHFLGDNFLLLLSGKLKNLFPTSQVFLISLRLIPWPVIWKKPTLTQAFSISLIVLNAFWVSKLFLISDDILIVGTVDYLKGEIILNTINITETVAANEIIEIQAFPESNDVLGLKDLYLTFNTSNTTINMVKDVIASGEDVSGVVFSRDYYTSSYANGELERK